MHLKEIAAKLVWKHWRKDASGADLSEYDDSSKPDLRKGESFRFDL